MKQYKPWMTSIIATLLLTLGVGLLRSVAAADSAAYEGPEDVVAAIKSSPAVQAEISRLRKEINAKESTPEKVKVVGLGSSCGVAGCGASYLVVVTVNRTGVNPQSASVLAMVRRSPKWELGRVSVVELKEKVLPETKLEIQHRYSSPLPHIERR